MFVKCEKRVQKVWTNVYSVSNKSPTIDFFKNIFAQLFRVKIWQQGKARFASSFFEKTVTSSIGQCFGKTRKSDFFSMAFSKI